MGDHIHTINRPYLEYMPMMSPRWTRGPHLSVNRWPKTESKKRDEKNKKLDETETWDRRLAVSVSCKWIVKESRVCEEDKEEEG